jgi:hypothetical protein
MAKLIYTLIAINVVAFVVSGCMALVATPNGVREFYRGQNGLVVTGKATADKDDSYHRGQRWFDERSTLKLQVNPDGNL